MEIQTNEHTVSTAGVIATLGCCFPIGIICVTFLLVCFFKGVPSWW